MGFPRGGRGSWGQGEGGAVEGEGKGVGGVMYMRVRRCLFCALGKEEGERGGVS